MWAMAISASRSFWLLPSSPNPLSAFGFPPFSPPIARSAPPRPRNISSSTMATNTASPSQTATEKEEHEFWERVIAHQARLLIGTSRNYSGLKKKEAAKLSIIEESRTLISKTRNAFVATVSQKYEGFPYTSLLDVAAEQDGSLITAVSSLSLHTKDLQKCPKCSLLIMKDKADRSDVVITYIGEAAEVPEHSQKGAREIFLAKHPDAFWVDFGDFKFLRIEPKFIRFLTGSATPFNRNGEFSGDEFRTAKVDPISEFSAPIASHMNKDHADETKFMVEKSLGVKVENAKIIDLDRLGLNVQIGFQGKPMKLRIPFPRPAESRKDVKTLIVEMTETPKS